MEIVGGILTNLLIQTAITAPRIYLREDTRSLYDLDEIRGLGIKNLKGLRRIRQSLSPEELREVEERERKYFEDVNELQTRKVVGTAGTIGGDIDPFDALPPESHDIQVKLPKKEGNILPSLSFSLPITQYAGPLYTGGRFFKPSEKFNKKDLAIIPMSDFDSFSRNHDIFYSLISAIPNEQKRKEFKKYADAVYHAQIYGSLDKPVEEGDLRNYQVKVAKSIAGLTALFNVTSNLIEAQEVAIEEVGSVIIDISRQVSGRFSVESFQEMLTLRGSQDLHPWIELYLSNTNRYEDFINDASVSNYLRAPEVLQRLENIGRLDIESELQRSGGFIREANLLRQLRNEELQDLANLNEQLYHREFYAPFDETEGGTLPVNEVLDRARVRMGISNLLANKTFWGNLATAVVTTAIFNKISEKAFNNEMARDPEFQKKVKEAFDDKNLKKGSDFYSTLAESFFRNVFGTIDYVEQTEDEIKMQLEALDFEIKDDPVLEEVRKLFKLNKANEQIQQEIKQEEQLDKTQEHVVNNLLKDVMELPVDEFQLFLDTLDEDELLIFLDEF